MDPGLGAAHFSSRDPPTDLVFERIVAGVSCRGFERTNEPVGSEVEGRGGGEVDLEVGDLARLRRATRTALAELISRRLDDVRLAVIMIDGIEIEERTHVVALGVTTEG